MDRKEVEEIIRRTYAARQAGDLDGTIQVFKNDAEFSINGPKDIWPNDMPAKGLPAIRGMMRGLIEAFEFVDHRPLDILVDGDRAAVHVFAKVRHRPTGKLAETEMLDLWSFGGGRCERLVQFVDTALVRQFAAP